MQVKNLLKTRGSSAIRLAVDPKESSGPAEATAQHLKVSLKCEIWIWLTMQIGYLPGFCFLWTNQLKLYRCQQGVMCRIRGKLPPISSRISFLENMFTRQHPATLLNVALLPTLLGSPCSLWSCPLQDNHHAKVPEHPWQLPLPHCSSASCARHNSSCA